jgi:rhamnogalacturonan endolyase
VAVKQTPSEAFVSWRYLETDPADIAFDVYRNGTRLNSKPIIRTTWYVDTESPADSVTYEVRPARNMDAPSGSYTLTADAPIGYVEIPLYRPQGGHTPDGRPYSYSAGDASIGDVDGDGNITVLDALKLLRAIYDESLLTQEEFLRADINGDGTIDIADFVTILNMMAEQ